MRRSDAQDLTFQQARETFGAAQKGETFGTAEHQDRLSLTDLGNCYRFVNYFGRDFRYCPALGWVVYNGTRWEFDELGAVMRTAKLTARLLYEEAGMTQDDDLRKAIGKHARASEAERKLTAMVTLARTEPTIAVRAQELDADPMLLNCPNGIVDLTTGELASHRREALMTKVAGVSYDPQMKCARWRLFLKEIFVGQTDLINYMQRALGYALTGVVRERVFFILHGGGANGKSTLVETMHAVLGDYGCNTRPETFLAKKYDAIPVDVASLRGARFVFANELNQGRKIDEGLIKSLTGRDTVTARLLRQNPFSFKPTFKIFLETNHLPTIAGTDNAIWSRVHPVPFDGTIAETDQDPNLPAKLLAEGPGILAWLVEGCLAWQRDGLGEPPRVRMAREDYREREDQVGSFLDDQAVLSPDEEVTTKDLYEAYQDWAKSSGEKKVLSKRAFGLAMKDRKFADYRTHKGRGWRGVRLRRHDEVFAEPGEPKEAGVLAD
ncbi:phage/plasmid primase, P4 family [Nitrospiraceae bacterium AH_259_D15_M11_P09]|nr:phage/plasmid primase, P4 family [Nitrospiraceae bacterium AH_259_D15_M11_P09]